MATKSQLITTYTQALTMAEHLAYLGVPEVAIVETGSLYKIFAEDASGLSEEIICQGHYDVFVEAVEALNEQFVARHSH